MSGDRDPRWVIRTARTAELPLVGELLAELEELGVVERTLVVVAATHGVELGEARRLERISGEPSEYRSWGAERPWQTVLRVPVILANTRLLPHGVRVEELVAAIDVWPTVADLVDLELEEPVDGRSFLTAILGTQRGEVGDVRGEAHQLAHAAAEDRPRPRQRST